VASGPRAPSCAGKGEGGFVVCRGKEGVQLVLGGRAPSCAGKGEGGSLLPTAYCLLPTPCAPTASARHPSPCRSICDVRVSWP
jgi:hypothetical protein